MAPQSRWLELMEVVTVGLPFCGFKIVVGLTCLANGATTAGRALVALGVIDLVINALNAVTLLALGRRTWAACTFSVLTPARRDLGNALDTMFSFSLVAVMIGGGHIASLSPPHLTAWNGCVIVNVLGAGLGRLGQSLRADSQARSVS